SDVRPKASLPDEAARRARGANAATNHRERRRSPPRARPRANFDQRDRRARRGPPLDGVPPLPGRGHVVCLLLVALSRREPASGSALVVVDREPGRANTHGPRRGVCVLCPYGGDVRESFARRAARPGPRAKTPGLLSLPLLDPE